MEIDRCSDNTHGCEQVDDVLTNQALYCNAANAEASANGANYLPDEESHHEASTQSTQATGSHRRIGGRRDISQD